MWSPFVHIFDIISLFAAELEEPKIGISGYGLSGYNFVICKCCELGQVYTIWSCVNPVPNNKILAVTQIDSFCRRQIRCC